MRNVRSGSQADIRAAKSHVRFTPESGHRLLSFNDLFSTAEQCDRECEAKRLGGLHIEHGLVFRSNFARSSAAISLAKACNLKASAGGFISVGCHPVVRRPRVLLVQPLRAQLRPSPQLGVLPLRQPLSSRPWRLRDLPPWPHRARPSGRLHAPPSPPPRVARVRQPRSSLSQRLRALPASPPGRAPPSRQLYASLARWLRAS